MENKDPIYSLIAMCGESDSGKTFSANILALQLAASDKVRIIDTENRAKLYRKRFPVAEIITMAPPFDLSKVIAEIEKCKKNGTQVLIIDSASLFWDRVNQIAEGMKDTVKNPMRIWAKLTPEWDAFKLAITSAPFHVITTWKVKDEIPQPGQAPKKKVVTRGGGKGLKFDYHLVFNLNEKREAMVIKDNYDIFSDWKEPKMIDAEIGKKIAKWLREN